MVSRLQSKEQEQFTIKEKSRMLVEMIAERKRFFAAQRAAEQRSKSPTKAHMGNKMCTYLKNQSGYKHNQLKGRSYDDIQKLFDKAYKQVNYFVPMDFEWLKTVERRMIAVASKQEAERKEQDLFDLHRLVIKRFESVAPEGYDLIIWRDLKTMIEPNEEDKMDFFNLWKLGSPLDDVVEGLMMNMHNEQNLCYDVTSMCRKAESDDSSFHNEMCYGINFEFSMTDLGSLKYFLGISVTRTSSGIFLSQAQYATKILQRASMFTKCQPTLSRSSAEAEYRGIANAVVETCWLRNLLRNHLIKAKKGITMAEPNLNEHISATRKNYLSDDNKGRMVEKSFLEKQGKFSMKIQIKNFEEHEQELNNNMTGDLEKPWSDNGVPYQLCDHICEPYHFKNGNAKWPTCSEDIYGFCNSGELPGMARVGCVTYFQDHKWYDELADGVLKEEALIHKARFEESCGDAIP
nr:retrotransposon protein, putative, Ty1-copia subclass [Tanacetum cinerariifolium]